MLLNSARSAVDSIGQTTQEVRDSQLDRALNMRPDVALLVAGVNDL